MPDNTPGAAHAGEAEDPPGPAEPLPYEVVTEASYAEEARRFRIAPTRGGVILYGPCPRCAHEMEFPHVSRVYKRIRLPRMRRSGSVGQPASAQSATGEPATPEQPAQPKPVGMVCTCTEDHQGRRPEEDGCGAYWNVTLGPAA
ncbi:hypothetical protein ACIOK4_43625 [Streptomyces bottropensis]|uniref:hypothetical protein n=1 Tax=Streptomyces bottropensis TaxID=42235 RepID=UPI00381B5B90